MRASTDCPSVENSPRLNSVPCGDAGLYPYTHHGHSHEARHGKDGNAAPLQNLHESVAGKLAKEGGHQADSKDGKPVVQAAGRISCLSASPAHYPQVPGVASKISKQA